MKQGLAIWETKPIGISTDTSAVDSRIEENDFACEIEEERNVDTLSPRVTRYIRRTVSHLEDSLMNEGHKDFSVDVHEVALDVHLEDIGWLCVVLRARTDMVVKAVNAVVGATILDAGIGIGNERALEESVQIIEDKVMHNAIAELSSKDLTLLGV